MVEQAKPKMKPDQVFNVISLKGVYYKIPDYYDPKINTLGTGSQKKVLKVTDKRDGLTYALGYFS